MINIYTDGSSRGNPGPGGYGIVMLYKDQRKELSQGYRLTTNNRMELTAAIKSLEYCETKKNNQPVLEHIKIFTDSIYVKEGITIWINKWEKNNWRTGDKKNVKNVDLWKKLKKLTKSKQIEWCWVKDIQITL